MKTTPSNKTLSWVKLPRAIRRSPVFTSSPWVVKIYIWLLTTARYKDGSIRTKAGRVVQLRVGQVLVGKDQIERELSWRSHRCTRGAYRAAISLLERHHFITKKATKRGTIITVLPFPDPEPVSGREDENRSHDHDRDHAGTQPSQAPIAANDATNITTPKIDRKEESDRQSKKEKTEKKKRVLADDTRSLLSDLSLLWAGVSAGQEIVWTPEREDQVLDLLVHYTPRQIKRAVYQYNQIVELGDDAFMPRRWTFERFFTPKVFDEVLGQSLDYFRKYSARPAAHLADIVGETQLSDYYGEDHGGDSDAQDSNEEDI